MPRCFLNKNQLDAKEPMTAYGPFLTDGIRQVLMDQRTFSKRRAAISGGTPAVVANLHSYVVTGPARIL
jgi:hypothetical protein